MTASAILRSGFSISLDSVNLRRPLVARLLRSVSWTVLGGVAAQGAVLVSSVVVARILGREAYGQFAMIQSTILTLTCLAGMGLGVTATKYVSEYRWTQPQEIGQILGLSSVAAFAAAVLVSLGLVAFAPILGTRTNGGNIVATGLRLSIPYLFFMTVNGYQVGALVGFEAFRNMARIGFLHGVASVAATWALAARFGLTGAVVAQALAAIVLWTLYHFAMAAECRSANVTIDYRAIWKRRSILLHTSIPAATSGVIAAVAIWWCNAHLAASSGYAALAIFTAASTIRSIVLFLPVLIMRVTMPFLNGMRSAGDLAGFRRTLRHCVALNVGIAVLLCALLTLTGQQVIRLFGRDFTGSPLLVLLVLSSVIFEVFANSLFQSLFAAGRLWRNLAIVTTWTAVLIASASLTTTRWGANGLAFSYLVAWCVSAAMYTASWGGRFQEGVES